MWDGTIKNREFNFMWQEASSEEIIKIVRN